MQARLLRVVAAPLFALAFGLACGEEDTDDDEGSDGGSQSCPADDPGNTSSCSGYTPGLSCTYGSATCTCSGISWNCVNGGGANNTTTGGPPSGSGGNGFGATGAPFGGGD